MAWTFRIRDDVRFTDGEPLTAHDVAFTINGIVKGDGSGDDLSMVERAEAEDAAVVCLTPQPMRTVTYYRFDGSVEVRCYNIDATVMKTMLRAKNGLVVLDDGVIEAKYNCRNIKPAADR